MLTPRDLGVPVKAVNWARVFAGQRQNGEPLVLACFGQQAGNLLVCDIDPQTGHCTQFSANLSGANYPTAAHFSAESGVLYIGSAYTGHLHRYDANLPSAQRHLEDLGAIDALHCRFPCAIDEAPDGTIYIGGYPGCSLTRFEPRTGEFSRFGRMDGTDMYFYPACGADSTIAGLVKMSVPHVVAFGRAGEFQPVGPRVDLEAKPTREPGAQALHLMKGDDGLLYILSDEGDFRLHGLEAIPVASKPSPASPSTLPDGTTVDFLEGHLNNHRVLQLLAPDGTLRLLNLDWQGDGTSLFLVHAGPDGKIYGSSMLPEYLFVYNPEGEHMRDLGACSEAIGEAYSMANYDGKLYIASYPGSRLSIYDPALPYQYGTCEGANPRDVGKLDDVGTRPRALLAGPAGKIWMGSFPDYGRWGGTLAWYDPTTGESRSHRHLVKDCSVVALEWVPELECILVGTSINGGSGTTPRSAIAPFVLWNPFQDVASETLDFGLNLNDGVLDLKYAGNGTVYAVVAMAGCAAGSSIRELRIEFVLIDILNRVVLDRSPFENENGPVEMSLRVGPDGAFYGCQATSFYRVIPGTAQRQTLWTTTLENEVEHIHASGALVGQTYYFGSNHRLRAFDLAACALQSSAR